MLHACTNSSLQRKTWQSRKGLVILLGQTPSTTWDLSTFGLRKVFLKGLIISFFQSKNLLNGNRCIDKITQKMLLCGTKNFCWNLRGYFRQQLLSQASYIGIFFPRDVALKSIENDLCRSCSALILKMLVKLTPQGAASVSNMFCNFYLVKNCKIANNSTTTVTRGKYAQFGNLKNYFIVCLINISTIKFY